ncbi:alpha/beta hydrolase fold domain-containing protein [Lignipirellula cremea]|uniref:Carboxylesterase NlhH n=1 Tax=Lignipirellula cremea TaxID=2528010 RepID=A0A518DZD9_9BACT|nr:alpha/beta hydrolase fold domain-containing protein [Lignipirellula cremea]QDU97185.1 Carboxylesterase NlhH [Lignipirellula cremea]
MLCRIVLPLLLLALTTGSVLGQPPQGNSPFRRLDRNQDGKLTRDEIPPQLRPLLQRIDTNGDGEVTAEEDRAFTARRRAGQGRPGPMRPGQGRPPAAVVSDKIETLRDLPYAATDNPRQTLDLYLPKERASDGPLPVVVFIHGGGWQNGDKGGGGRMIAPLVESGHYIGVSIGYRLTGEASWPAQIHDCKAAIRWIKANAQKYQLDPEKIGVTGTSAGGHLVAMLGTSGDVPELEGKLGQHLDQNGRVACVVDQYGPSDLLSMGGFHDQAGSPESKLVGGQLTEHQETARQASPSHYVSAGDPPFLLLHGTADNVVPYSQSELLHKLLQKAGVASLLVPIEGAGHGRFRSEEPAQRMRDFFDLHLRGQKVDVSSEPISQTERPGR